MLPKTQPAPITITCIVKSLIKPWLTLNHSCPEYSYLYTICINADFRLEKGRLHTEVYPKLREHCSSQGYELHIVDLHWKTELEEKEDHQFPELCLDELRRKIHKNSISYVTHKTHIIIIFFHA